MPTLSSDSYFQRTPVNYWDSFSPTVNQALDSIRLFDKSHARHDAIYLQHDEPVGKCERLLIRAWRARTNIQPCWLARAPAAEQAVHAWASMTTVMLGMGAAPLVFAPLSELMDHKVEITPPEVARQKRGSVLSSQPTYEDMFSVLVPPRQNYFVAVATSTSAVSDMHRALRAYSSKLPDLLVWIHLYGDKILRVDLGEP